MSATPAMISSREAHRLPACDDDDVQLHGRLALAAASGLRRPARRRAVHDAADRRSPDRPRDERRLQRRRPVSRQVVEGDVRSRESGMTAPGEEVTLRWRGTTSHSTLQLHLPAEAILRGKEDLLARRRFATANAERAVERGSAAPAGDPRSGRAAVKARRKFTPSPPRSSSRCDMLVRHAGREPQKAPTRDALRMQRVRDHHACALERGCFARGSGESRVSQPLPILIRMFKHVYGETPYQRLTRLRIERACRRPHRRQASWSRKSRWIAASPIRLTSPQHSAV